MTPKMFVPAKFDVTTYAPDSAESPRQDFQWMICHIYYLSLVYASSLPIAWRNNHNSRLLKQNLPIWTSKYISPHLIAANFSEVIAWAADQGNNSMEENSQKIGIRVNKSIGEVLASVDVGSEDDEQTVAICIRLAPSFPFTKVEVTSRNDREIIESKRWEGWLQTTTKMIVGGNNNIIDGLMVWRRNVQGYLEKRSECCICYSLVAEDGKLPTKNCGTCKNTFHALCLNKWFSSSRERKCPLCRQEIK